MTISAYIANILSQYEGIEIDVSHVRDGSDQYGLYKSPGRYQNEFSDGSYEITENFQFLARQSSVTSSERKETDEWLEDLTYWVDDYAFVNGFPDLDGGRIVTGLAITGSPYVMSAEDANMIYQITISITYTREREEI